jgi:hypothetical protein
MINYQKEREKKRLVKYKNRKKEILKVVDILYR